MGADIFCVVCGQRAYPALGPTGTREDFDLMRLDREGRPAENPKGKWFCSRHFKRRGRDYEVTAESIWPDEDSEPIEATS